MTAATRWIGVIVGLLAFGVVTQIVLLIAAVNDPSFAVDPGYGSEASTWDADKRHAAQSERLGWTADLTTAPAPRRLTAQIAVELYDRWGKPIRDAELHVTAFHNARAARRFTAELAHLEEGRYVGTLPIDRPGVWEFQLAAVRGEEIFETTLRKSVPRSTVLGQPYDADAAGDQK